MLVGHRREPQVGPGGKCHHPERVAVGCQGIEAGHDYFEQAVARAVVYVDRRALIQHRCVNVLVKRIDQVVLAIDKRPQVDEGQLQCRRQIGEGQARPPLFLNSGKGTLKLSGRQLHGFGFLRSITALLNLAAFIPIFRGKLAQRSIIGPTRRRARSRRARSAPRLFRAAE